MHKPDTRADGTMQTQVIFSTSYVVQIMLTIFVAQVQVSACLDEQLDARKVPCCRNKVKPAACRQSWSDLKYLLCLRCFTSPLLYDLPRRGGLSSDARSRITLLCEEYFPTFFYSRQ